MTWEADLAVLDVFWRALPSLFLPDEVGEALPRHPEVPAAALRVLRVAFTSVPAPALDARSRALVDLAGWVVAQAGTPWAERLWDEVALRVAHPAAFQAVVPALKEAMDDDAVERAVVAALTGADEAAAARALDMQYYLWGSLDGFRLSTGGAAEVARAVGALRTRATAGGQVASALERYQAPYVMR